MSENSKTLNDPLAPSTYGADQRYALVWFFAAIVIGVIFVCNLSKIDSFLIETDGQVLDYEVYRENRVASTSIASESVDVRTESDYVTTVNQLDK